MRTVLALSTAMLLFVSTTSMAATVEYQHPDLTIVAEEEPLDVVLKSLGKEMRIYVTVPTGLNTVVNCDIQHQPITQAFKTLLGDMSYSLEWEKKSGKLVGLTILAGGEGAAVATVSGRPSHTQSVVEQVAPVTGSSTAGHGVAGPVEQSDLDTPVASRDASMAEHEAQMEAELEEREAQMVEEREAHEAEMALRQQEQEIAHEERMKEEEARIEAEAATHLAAEGIDP